MESKDQLGLRDQFAIAAMQALLTSQKPFIVETDTGNTSGNSSGTESSKISHYTTYNTSIMHESELNEDYIKRIESKIEGLARLSYKIADQMRKVRLTAFE